MILVTGATGRLGSRIIRHLCSKVDPAHIAAGVRDIGKAQALKNLDVAIRQIDYEDSASLRKAFEGVEKLLVISSDGPASVVIRHHHNAISAAKDVGVSCLAFTSILDVAEDSPFYFARVYREAEAELATARVPVAILRCGVFTDLNLPWFAQAISSGELRLPAGDAKVSFISRDDIAVAAANTLMSDVHESHIYQLTGGTALGYKEICGLLAEISKTPISYSPCSPGDYYTQMSIAGTPDWLLHALSTMFQSIVEGRFEKRSDDFAVLTNRAPTTMREFLQTTFADDKKGF